MRPLYPRRRSSCRGIVWREELPGDVMILAELTEKNVTKTSFITERGYLFLFRYETLSPMKREKCELRRFFRPVFPRCLRGRRILFLSVFCCRGDQRWQISRFFLSQDGEWPDRDRNPGVFRQLMFQYGTVKNILCFISEQKREKFFCSPLALQCLHRSGHDPVSAMNRRLNRMTPGLIM